MRYINEPVFSSTAVTGTNVYTSGWLDASSMLQCSVQAVTTGTNPTGTLKLQFSNDSPTTGSPVNASDVTGATVYIFNID
jgi:hypothetical protein